MTTLIKDIPFSVAKEMSRERLMQVSLAYLSKQSSALHHKKSNSHTKSSSTISQRRSSKKGVKAKELLSFLESINE